MTNLSELRIFLCVQPTDMRFSFDTLMGQAEQIFEQDPLSGHLFLFLNRRRDQLKILFWDRDGFCICHKRLEAGTFGLPKVEAGDHKVELDARQLRRLLAGIDLQGGWKRKRYRRPG